MRTTFAFHLLKGLDLWSMHVFSSFMCLDSGGQPVVVDSKKNPAAVLEHNPSGGGQGAGRTDSQRLWRCPSMWGQGAGVREANVFSAILLGACRELEQEKSGEWEKKTCQCHTGTDSWALSVFSAVLLGAGRERKQNSKKRGPEREKMKGQCRVGIWMSRCSGGSPAHTSWCSPRSVTGNNTRAMSRLSVLRVSSCTCYIYFVLIYSLLHKSVVNMWHVYCAFRRSGFFQLSRYLSHTRAHIKYPNSLVRARAYTLTPPPTIPTPAKIEKYTRQNPCLYPFQNIAPHTSNKCQTEKLQPCALYEIPTIAH